MGPFFQGRDLDSSPDRGREGWARLFGAIAPGRRPAAVPSFGHPRQWLLARRHRRARRRGTSERSSMWQTSECASRRAGRTTERSRFECVRAAYCRARRQTVRLLANAGVMATPCHLVTRCPHPTLTRHISPRHRQRQQARPHDESKRRCRHDPAPTRLRVG